MGSTRGSTAPTGVPCAKGACANRPGRFARTLGLTSTLSRFFSLCMGMHGRRRRARGALKSPRRRACAAGVARCAQNPVETLGATLRAMRQKHRGCGSQQSGLNMSGRFALRVRLGRAREVSVRQTGGQKAGNQRRKSLSEGSRILLPGPGMGGNGLGMQGAAAGTPRLLANFGQAKGAQQAFPSRRGLGAPALGQIENRKSSDRLASWSVAFGGSGLALALALVFARSQLVASKALLRLASARSRADWAPKARFPSRFCAPSGAGRP